MLPSYPINVLIIISSHMRLPSGDDQITYLGSKHENDL